MGSSLAASRRGANLRGKLARLEQDARDGKYIDVALLSALRKKIEVLEAHGNSGEGVRYGDAEEIPEKARDLIDTSRFTLWHGTYRAQIRDFSTIRDGDVVLLRNLDESSILTAPTDNHMEEPSILTAESQSVQGEDDDDDNDDDDDDEEAEKEEEDQAEEKLSEYEVSDEGEDVLRLRRLGLKQLLSAVRSGRSLFGQNLHGARAIFRAMDRDADGFIDYNDVVNALKRLDIPVSSSSTNELAKALLNGNDAVGMDDFCAGLEGLAGSENLDDAEAEAEMRAGLSSPLISIGRNTPKVHCQAKEAEAQAPVTLCW